MNPASFYNKWKEERKVDQLIPIISQVGFPIVVTLYLLYRIEAKLDLVVQSLQTLPERMRERA
ncbi:YvrJ protein family protein [Bacillus sp. OV166]|nr:YvrJ protein family protein [Bacillus sp. OV166]